MIPRNLEITQLHRLFKICPIVAMLGIRQSGKTTLARHFNAPHYFDLENPRDLSRLNNPLLTLESLTGLIVIDEVQRRPDLFPLLRFLVDNNPQQRYLLTGSASPELLSKSSESLAGRIAYYPISGFRLSDVGNDRQDQLFLRGGLPRSFLAETDADAFIWLDNFITTFLERDISQLGITIPSSALRRFWTMLSHYHGQRLNYSEIGRSYGISDVTCRRYIDILVNTFAVRLIMPWHSNTQKRLVKSPKLYIRDSGIFHALQGIHATEQLQSNPKLGASWEGFALEQVLQHLSLNPDRCFSWASHGGPEVDLIWQHSARFVGVEFKYADAPCLNASMHAAVKELDLEHLWVVYPGPQSYRLSETVTVVPLRELNLIHL